MSASQAQPLFAPGWLTTDHPSHAWWVREVPDDPQELHLQALVASGDYFETLAASLEQIVAAIPANSVEHYQLQHIIGQLLYLQKHYDITKK